MKRHRANWQLQRHKQGTGRIASLAGASLVGHALAQGKSGGKHVPHSYDGRMPAIPTGSGRSLDGSLLVASLTGGEDVFRQLGRQALHLHVSELDLSLAAGGAGVLHLLDGVEESAKLPHLLCDGDHDQVEPVRPAVHHLEGIYPT